jgi:hypothetical protein
MASFKPCTSLTPAFTTILVPFLAKMGMAGSISSREFDSYPFADES